MPKYFVEVSFSGTQSFEVEADNEREAQRVAHMDFDWDAAEFDIDNIAVWEDD